MTSRHDAHPVLVVAHRVDTARSLRRRLDRPPLRATAMALGVHGWEPAALEPDATVVLALPPGGLRAWDVVNRLQRGSRRPLVVVVADEPASPVADLCLLAGEIVRRFGGLVRTDEVGDVPVDSAHVQPRTTRHNRYAATH